MTTPRTRKPGSERRSEIVAALLHIIGERGFAAVTTARLAEEVGMTQGALFRHFASLQEMMREAVARSVMRVEKTFPDPELPALERLLTLAERRVALLGSDAGVSWLLRSDEALLVLPREASEMLRAVVSRSQAILLQALKDGVAQGSVRSDLPPEVLRVLVSGTIHALAGSTGIHRTRGQTEGRRPRGPSRRAVLAALATILKGNSGGATGGSA